MARRRYKECRPYFNNYQNKIFSIVKMKESYLQYICLHRPPRTNIVIIPLCFYWQLPYSLHLPFCDVNWDRSVIWFFKRYTLPSDEKWILPWTFESVLGEKNQLEIAPSSTFVSGWPGIALPAGIIPNSWFTRCQYNVTEWVVASAAIQCNPVCGAR